MTDVDDPEHPYTSPVRDITELARVHACSPFPFGARGAWSAPSRWGAGIG